MSLQEDIDKIKQMEDDYFILHGEYFETDNSKVVTIPMPGEDKQLKEFSKFKGNRDKNPAVTKIPFLPKEKDWKFIIGQVIFVNSAEGGYEAGAEKRAYMIVAQRKNFTGDKYEQYIFYGGDQSVINDFTDGDSVGEFDYDDSVDKFEVIKNG
jgi:hypothetical protein